MAEILPSVRVCESGLHIFSCVFQEDVESFMKQPGNEKAEAVITRLHEQHQKYKFMELNLSQKKLR